MKPALLFLSLAIICSHAIAVGPIPTDVRSFIDQRDGCDYFRGEPWDSGNEPEAIERREFIIQNIKKLCAGTDKRLAGLRKKYRNNFKIISRLRSYEDRIELSEGGK